jgi:flagellar biosynthetic protein FliP
MAADPAAGLNRRRAKRLAAGVILGGAVLFAVPAAAAAAPSSSSISAGSITANSISAESISADSISAGSVQAGSAGSVRLTAPNDPIAPTDPSAPVVKDNNITVSVPGQHSQVISIILLVTLLGVAPSVLLLCTSFTKIVVVLSLARSAIGTPSIPPNQVLVGLALFLSLFVMGPTVDQMQKQAIQPYSAGKINATQAYRAGVVPLQDFMLKHTRDEELALMTKAADEPLPKNPKDVDLRTLIPAFVLSELRGAFIIGFVIFIPFLVVDIVVSAILMSLGMVMLPPSLVSLPFKLLLFILVDGWSLIITTLIGSYH